MADYSAIIDAARVAGELHQQEGGKAYAVVPDGCRLEDITSYLSAPPRAEQAVTVHDATSFTAYVNRFKGDTSVIFADQQGDKVTAVIDYHGKDAAAFSDHRITLPMPKSIEWQTWAGASGKSMKQEAFARFIEENRVDIREPDGATVLEIAKHLETRRKVDFTSATRLADGTRQFSYKEDVQGTTSKGNIKVPEEFKIGIPVYFGGQPYQITAFLRYRISGGELHMWFELHRLAHVEHDAFQDAIAFIKDDAKAPLFMGSI